MTKMTTATDVLREAEETGRDLREVLAEAYEQNGITRRRPAWATDEYATSNDDGSGLWFERPVGRGYYVPGIGHDINSVLDDDDPVTFTLMWAAGNEDLGIYEPYIDQNDGHGMAFANADAMRRYAQVLLEIANDVDRVTGGAL